MQKYTVVINDIGTILWYKEGTYILHRENGPAIENTDGDKFWYKNGKYHKEDGPAIEYANGDKFWYKKGKIHREDGPAKEYSDGSKVWYLNGKEYSEAEFLKLTSKTPVDPSSKTPIDSCDGKEVVIEGKKYKLTLIDK